MKPNSWIDFYLDLAFRVARKSPDPHTQHGCYITDRNNIPLGFGFNGFPRGVDDSDLPRNRPASDSLEDFYDSKYPWMAHSERNALAHCQHRPENGIAYVTGQCCRECIYALWQHGITTVYMANRHGSVLCNNKPEQKWFERFITKTKLDVYYVEPKQEWLDSLIFRQNK